MRYLITALRQNRHFLYGLLASVLFSGCVPDEQYTRPVKTGNNIIEYKGYEIETIEYDSHDYIICRGVRVAGHPVSMVHSASCKKCNGG